jgi:ferrochelatase
MSDPGARGVVPPAVGRVGVLLMTFGTAATLDDVPAYLASVRGGKPAPEQLVQEFQRRFALVGGSPLTRITRAQASALEAELNAGSDRCIVRVGMRHAPPFIGDALRELVDAGVRRVVAVILSPQYSDVIMGGYLRALRAAEETIAAGADLSVAGAWYDDSDFLDGLAARLRAILGTLQPGERDTAPVLFTAHSLPRSVADGEPGYIAQLQATAAAVAERTELPPERWAFAYQSAGHTPEPWLTPDVKDLLPGLRERGHTTVVVAPVQFLADHLEVLYDVDVAARQEAEALGMNLVRTEMLNCDPSLIHALVNVVRAAA